MKNKGDVNGTISSTEHLRQAYEKDPEAVINLTVQLILFLSGLLTIAFIVLKLCGVIAWGWSFVFFPVFPVIAVSAIGVATGIVAAICGDD